MIERGGFAHFMLKEIFEQPDTVKNTMRGRLLNETGTAKLGGLNLTAEELLKFDNILITACGTSWHSALIGEFLIEELARVPVEVEYASELRYRNPIISDKTLCIVISQSGETADTLAAMREAQRRGRARAGHRERGGLDDRARVGRRHLHPRGAGDRRRVDEGVQQPGDGARALRAQARAAARAHGARGEAHRGRDAEAPRPDRRDSRDGARDRGDRGAVQARHELSVSGSRLQLPRRARRARSSSRRSATSTRRAIRPRR